MIPDDAALVLAAAQSMRVEARDRLAASGRDMIRVSLRGYQPFAIASGVDAYALDLEARMLARESWTL